MKKIIPLITILCLCFVLTSCGNATLSGDPFVFKNANESFSIELPAEGTDSNEQSTWTINEDTDGDILDLTDSAETVRVIVQGVSKGKVAQVATDFESYKTYVTENTFADLIKNAKLKEASLDVPEFAKSSLTYTYTAKKTEGVIVFIESERAYYTYLIVASDGAYSANDKALKSSILSLTETPASEDNE